MKNEEGAESPGSAAKRSLQRLLELEDLPESSSVSTEVDAAKKVLATWASRPFDVAESYVDMLPIYEILVELMRAYPNLQEYLTLAANQVKELRETLNQYHTSVDLVPNAESTLLRYDQSIQSRAEAVAAGKSYADNFEQAQMDIARLKQELETARVRRDEVLMKINENLDKAKAADTTVRTLKDQLPVYRTSLHRPPYLLRVAASQHEGCVAILRDIARY